MDASGACRAWGGNEYGQAGVNDEDDSEDDSDEDDATRPLDGTEVASPERLHQSRKNRRDDGVHVCLHVSSPAKILRGVRVSQVACGGMNSFAVTEKTGEVYQWGMPVGSEKEPARRPALVPGAVGVTQIAAGTFHAVALQRDGRVVSWGNGDYGQLGLGRPGNWDQPQVVESLSRAGVVLVRAGGWHSAAITAGRVCYVWGRGEYGRLGQGDKDAKDKQRPVEIKLPWSGASDRGHGGHGGGGGGGGGGSDARAAGGGGGSSHGGVPTATGGSPHSPPPPGIVDIALGGTHTCVLDETGAVASFGRNNHGRLGRVAYGKWSGTPGRVVFPPPPGGGRWRCTGIVAGGRHTLATAVPVPRERADAESRGEKTRGGSLAEWNSHCFRYRDV